MPFGNSLRYVQRDSPVHRYTTPTAQIWSNLKHESIYMITSLSSTIICVTLCKELESMGYEPLVQQRGRYLIYSLYEIHWSTLVRKCKIYTNCSTDHAAPTFQPPIHARASFPRQTSHQGTTGVWTSFFGDAHLFIPNLERSRQGQLERPTRKNNILMKSLV